MLIAAVPNDPLVEQQAHLEVIRAFDAWNNQQGAGAVVAVLDTGVDLEHPDLDGRLVPGVDLVDPGTEPDDPQGHGTIVAGIVAANADNGQGTAGVAPEASIMPIRVLDAEGRGDSQIVADGIRYAITQEVEIINLSLAEVQQEGLIGLSLVQNAEVRQAISEADAAGILVVAAAGNAGRSSTPYASDSPVLVVGATTGADDRVWIDSNVDDRTIFAPGVDIYSTWEDGRYARGDGTSFATPIVAGGAAVLMGAGADSVTTRQLLVDNAVDIGIGLGRIDLAAAVQAFEVAAPVAPAPASTGVATPDVAVAASPRPEPTGSSTAPDVGLEVVQEVPAVPQATPVPEPTSVVTEAPPDIATVTTPTASPATTAETEPTSGPTPADAAEPLAGNADLRIGEGSGGMSVRTAATVAGIVLGADVILLGVLLGRRRRDTPTA